MKWLSTLRALLHRRRYESEFDEELEFHLAARAADLERSGSPPTQARRRARVEFGAMESHKHDIRHVRGLRLFDQVAGDLRYAVRTLRRSPAFTAVTVGSLALAIGANTNIFSVAHQLLYVRLGVPHPEQLRMLSAIGPEPSVVHSSWGSSGDQDGQFWLDSIPYPVFKQLQASGHNIAGIAGYKDVSVSVTANNEARPQVAMVVSGNLYDVLRATPQLGRGILPSDEGASGTGFVAVLSDRYWRTVFGGRPDVLGKSIRVNGNVLTVVGVNPPGFTGPASTTTSPDLFVPISLVSRLRSSNRKNADYIDTSERWWVSMIARLAPGVGNDRAAAELSVLLESAVRSNITVKAGEHIPHTQVDDGSRGRRFSDSARTPLQTLLALTGLVLLLACVNIANLMLARTSARMRELGVRLALGATRARILRQIVTESLLLSAAGGAFGMLLGYLGRNLLIRMYIGREYLTRPVDIPFDWTVFLVTVVMTIATGLLFGILPAWQATRANISAGLKESSQSTTRRQTLWTGKFLIAFQLALSTLLVAGAALFVRTLWNLNHVDAGFSTADLLEFDLDLPSERYPGTKVNALLQRAYDHIGALPGMQARAFATPPLLDGSQDMSGFYVEGQPEPVKDSDDNASYYTTVSPGFLEFMGIPLLRGRDISASDSATSPLVAVINQSAARKLFPGMDPLGRRFKQGSDPNSKEPITWFTVVGICADSQYSDLKRPRGPLYFAAAAQSEELTGGTFLIRTSLPSAQVIATMRKAIQSLDSDLPIKNVRTLDEKIADSLRQERLIATLTAGFGVLALLLASIGIYGLMAYTVTQRTNEIGIRLALGARRHQVRLAILREITVLTTVGILVGTAAVFVAMHSMRGVLYGSKQNVGRGMLFGLHGYDPASLTVTVAILTTVAILAAWLPAARASRIEPMQALRSE